MDKINFDKQRIIKLASLFVLSVVLLVVVILAQQQQNTRSKAREDVYNAFDVTDNAGSTLKYDDQNGVRVYKTESLDVRIKVSDLNRLAE